MNPKRKRSTKDGAKGKGKKSKAIRARKSRKPKPTIFQLIMNPKEDDIPIQWKYSRSTMEEENPKSRESSPPSRSTMEDSPSPSTVEVIPKSRDLTMEEIDTLIKENMEESDILSAEYANLNSRMYGRNGNRMDEIEKLLDDNSKEWRRLINFKAQIKC